MINCTFENGGHGKLRHVVVDCIVLKENKILLVKRSENLDEGGKWGIIGGFVEQDEIIKQTVTREIFEETGYRTSNIKFLMIIDNPKRLNEQRQNISFVFVCTALEKEGTPDNESSKQEWFELNNLPNPDEFAFDHYEIIQSFLNQKEISNPLFKSK